MNSFSQSLEHAAAAAIAGNVSVRMRKRMMDLIEDMLGWWGAGVVSEEWQWHSMWVGPEREGLAIAVDTLGKLGGMSFVVW